MSMNCRSKGAAVSMPVAGSEVTSGSAWLGEIAGLGAAAGDGGFVGTEIAATVSVGRAAVGPACAGDTPVGFAGDAVAGLSEVVGAPVGAAAVCEQAVAPTRNATPNAYERTDCGT